MSYESLTHLAKIFISIPEGIIRKKSYERRDYESAVEKSLSLAVPKKGEKKNSGSKGLNSIIHIPDTAYTIVLF